MSPAIVASFICGCVLLLVGVVAFFGSRQVRSTDDLTKSVNLLNTTIAVQAEKIGRHDEDIDELKRKACQNPDCPFRGDRWRPN